MKTSAFFVLFASSSTGVLVDGFTSPTSLTQAYSKAVSSSSLSVGSVAPDMMHVWRNKIEEDDEQECHLADTASPSLDGLLGSSAPPLPQFSEEKAQLRLDGLEPYVLVSAITATTSFGVVTSGSLFGGNDIFSSGSVWEKAFRVLLLSSSTSSSCLGLYALGIFSFSIMYSKAALSREDDEAHDLYQEFFDATASYRYKGYQAFMLSLILLTTDLFLFALAYLPEHVQPLVALGSAPIIYTCWKDWQAIVSAASIIYKPVNYDRVVAETVNDVESRRKSVVDA